MKKIISNFSYQLIFQIVKVVIPIITVPIVSKSLGVDNIGTYRFSTSIVTYFVLFATLGITLYGQRSIAMVSDNKEKLSKRFLEIEIIAIISNSLVLLVYLLFIIFLKDNTLFVIQIFTVISVSLDISWFFLGLEEFKYVTFRSVIITIITFICIILFVNDTSDLYIYTFIQSFSIFLSQIILWPFLLKKITFYKISFKSVLNHLRGIISFFIPTLIISFYTNMNIILLGLLSSNKDVAFYSNAIILANIVITLTTSLDTVLLPNLSYLYSQKKIEEIKSIWQKSIDFQLFITIPAYFGISLISEKMVPWFFGTDFYPVTKIIPILSLIIIIVPLGMSISRQYLMPFNKMKSYNLGLVIGAILSIGINILLIPLLGVWSAVLATLISELAITGIRVNSFVNDTKFKFNKKSILKYIIAGISMFIIINYLTKNLSPTISTTIIQITFGIVLYVIILIVLREKNVLFIIKKINTK